MAQANSVDSGEWSVLTLGYQVPFAYFAMCEIQRGAKKKKVETTKNKGCQFQSHLEVNIEKKTFCSCLVSHKLNIHIFEIIV